MNIIGLADVHGSRRAVESARHVLAAAEVVIFTGDITNFGRAPETEQVVAPLLEGSARVLAVSGNCDYPQVDDYLTEKGINLHGRGVVINGLGLVGAGGSLVTPFHTPNELTEEEMQQVLQQGLQQLPSPATPLVLVSHQPPYDTKCDLLSSGEHVGSHAVRSFIETYQPLLCFTAHIHEAVAVDYIGQTAVINPGQLRKGGYAWAQIADGALKDGGIGYDL